MYSGTLRSMTDLGLTGSNFKGRGITIREQLLSTCL